MAKPRVCKVCKRLEGEVRFYRPDGNGVRYRACWDCMAAGMSKWAKQRNVGKRAPATEAG